MTNYILLARGASLETARVLAVCADREIVKKFIAELADEVDERDERSRVLQLTHCHDED